MRVDGYTPVGRPSQDPAAQGTGQVRPQRPVGGEARSREEAPVADSVRLSPEALQAARAQEIDKVARELEEVRPEMVRYAQEFLTAGKQNDQGTLEATAGRLSQVLGV